MSYKIIECPAKWMSAHRENIYKIKFPVSIIGSGFNSGGYLRILLSSPFPLTAEVGQRVYIADAPYKGYHIIRAVNSTTDLVLETVYTSNISGAYVIFQIVAPDVKIYKGYKQGEIVLVYDGGTIDLYDIMPRELVATFKPEANLVGQLEFDLCGYLKTVIEAPYRAAYNPDEVSYLYRVSSFGIPLLTYCPKYYNKVDLILGERWCFGAHYVANAAIKTQELNRDFVDTNRQMNPLTIPAQLFNQ